MDAPNRISRKRGDALPAGGSSQARNVDVDQQPPAERRIAQFNARAMQFGSTLNDRQPEAISISAAAGFAVEPGKHRGSPFRRNPRPVVGHLDRGETCVLGDRQLHLTPSGHVTHGVLDEVAQQRRQSSLVTAHQ